MRCEEVVNKSPLRLLDQAIGGGLGAGNVGAMLARHGVGKTAFLVGLALDSLLRGRSVLHVSLDQPVDKTGLYYEEILAAMARECSLEDSSEARLKVERGRRILSYLDNTFSAGKLSETLAFLKNHGGFEPKMIIMDGYEFCDTAHEDLMEFRRIAADSGAEVWMSMPATVGSDHQEGILPEPLQALEPSIDVILYMAHDGSGVQISLLKSSDGKEQADLKLAFDPTSMLLTAR